eukprot:CAMPEP_0197662208 /NCGR_PEP_ID=MMETSP1338-20131121/52469_1 /TAXON_ID=43686 ORGANISM="Pelagodinium beii, Strain RCC1491" /NCGR_SAMPLE_ID=MMETSP1338 /ASSEMBLY_ACC=CAM_ASM_000754 /LENGTH=462 /DNA_ID=CAMNT_0043239939 /DNA_START=44 /DNA_END=1432 /DNA_ORIENTATION=-
MGLPSQAAAVVAPARLDRKRRLDDAFSPEKTKQCRVEVAAPAFKRARIEEDFKTEAELLADLDAGDGSQVFNTYPLVTRERECGELDSFLQGCLGSQGKGSSLYLSGGPGTGKTCSARGAAQTSRKQRPGTRIVEVNCMDLQQCSIVGLLSKVMEVCSPCTKISSRGAVSSLVASVASALCELGEEVILIVDEVDQLVRRRQKSSGCPLELLFGLPQHPKAPRLALVAVANAVDLLARSVTPAASRLCTSLLFEPYSTEQLRAITKGRFKSAGDLGAEAEKALGRVNVELRVRQVAKRSGDCRHIVNLCEEGLALRLAATDTADQEKSSSPATPSPRPASKAYDPLDDVKELPMEHQVLLCALASAAAEAARFSEVFQSYKSLLLRLRQPLDGASKPQVMSALTSLEQRGLLSLRGGKAGGKARGKSRTGSSEQISELAVSRKALKYALTRANPTLAQWLNA